MTLSKSLTLIIRNCHLSLDDVTICTIYDHTISVNQVHLEFLCVLPEGVIDDVYQEVAGEGATIKFHSGFSDDKILSHLRAVTACNDVCEKKRQIGIKITTQV